MVEPQPSKLIMPVRSRSAALSKRAGQGSILETVGGPSTTKNRCRATNVQQRATPALFRAQLRKRSTPTTGGQMAGQSRLRTRLQKPENVARRPAPGGRPFSSFLAESYRPVKGRCGTSLRCVSSLGPWPPLDGPGLWQRSPLTDRLGSIPSGHPKGDLPYRRVRHQALTKRSPPIGPCRACRNAKLARGTRRNPTAKRPTW
jgi:hypothetical protein